MSLSAKCIYLILILTSTQNVTCISLTIFNMILLSVRSVSNCWHRIVFIIIILCSLLSKYSIVLMSIAISFSIIFFFITPYCHQPIFFYRCLFSPWLCWTYLILIHPSLLVFFTCWFISLSFRIRKTSHNLFNVIVITFLICRRCVGFCSFLIAPYLICCLCYCYWFYCWYWLCYCYYFHYCYYC